MFADVRVGWQSLCTSHMAREAACVTTDCYQLAARTRMQQLISSARSFSRFQSVCSSCFQERPDVAYHLVAVDFLPTAVIQASLARLATEFASGGPMHRYCAPTKGWQG
jgi:hypothetical protein